MEVLQVCADADDLQTADACGIKGEVAQGEVAESYAPARPGDAAPSSRPAKRIGCLCVALPSRRRTAPAQLSTQLAA